MQGSAVYFQLQWIGRGFENLKIRLNELIPQK